ncbi:MAG: hypothetical protein ABS61_05500 [Microbacterium sp. SCN 70-18]|nr:MAG: hypothetical protein ABS61_05500 [Microbacterium sp. SCN 70-18]
MVLAGQPESSVELAEAVVRVVPYRLDPDAVLGHVHDQSREECRQQVPAHCVGCSAVQATWVGEELKKGERGIGTVPEPLCRELQLFLDGRSLECGLLDPLSDLAHRQGARRCEFDESFFLCFELVQLLAQLSLGVAVLREDVVDGLRDGFLHLLEVIGRDPFGRNDRDDLRLELVDARARGRAQSPLVGSADEVLVDPAVTGVP